MAAYRWMIVFLALLSGACATSYRVWYGHSPDRRHRVEVVERGGHQQLQIDDEPPRRYRGVAIETIRFSEDSERLAYAAETDSGWVVVVDSVPGRLWTGIGEVVFGPDHRLAYVAGDLEGWRVVLEGALSPLYEAVMQGSLTFSPEGERLAFVVAEGDSFRVVVDGVPGPLYEAVGALKFDPEGQRLAYAASRDGRPFLVLNDRPIGPFLLLADFTLGPGDRLGMLVRGEEGWRAVIDGREGEVFDDLGAIHFSQSGRYAYAARRDSLWFVIQDGERSPAYSGVGEIIFGGESLAYEARLDEGAFVVVDGARSPSLERVGSFTISPDGAHLAYLGEPRGGDLSVFYDGAVYAAPRVLEGTLVLSDDGLHWACLVVDESGKGMEILIDGEVRHPFDFEEMVALFMSDRDASSPRREETLRRWVKAELEKFF